MFSGANERIRTADLRITSALLYQLSHVGVRLQNEANTQYTETSCAPQEGGAKFISVEGRFGALAALATGFSHGCNSSWCAVRGQFDRVVPAMGLRRGLASRPRISVSAQPTWGNRRGGWRHARPLGSDLFRSRAYALDLRAVIGWAALGWADGRGDACGRLPARRAGSS